MDNEEKVDDGTKINEVANTEVTEATEQKDQPEVDKPDTETTEKSEKSEKSNEFSDIFVTESDTFKVKVRYYKNDADILVDGVDDDFDPKQSCKEFSVVFKYPDQGDSKKITAQVTKMGNSLEELDVRAFMNLEFARVLCLIRSWDIGHDLITSNIFKLNPKIVKSMTDQVRERLGMSGII